jgi:hypothetical protein
MGWFMPRRLVRAGPRRMVGVIGVRPMFAARAIVAISGRTVSPGWTLATHTAWSVVGIAAWAIYRWRAFSVPATVNFDAIAWGGWAHLVAIFVARPVEAMSVGRAVEAPVG